MLEKLKSKKHSFRFQMIIVFCLVSFVPLFLSTSWAYQNTRKELRENLKERSRTNMEQADMGISRLMYDYYALVNRICIDETIVEIIEELNEGGRTGLKRVLLREALRNYASENETIYGITVVAESGEIGFYDVVASGAGEKDWLEMLGFSADELYQEVSRRGEPVFYPTAYATTFGNQSYYLFHVGIPMPDYRNVSRTKAVVLISVSQEVLMDLCRQQTQQGSGQEMHMFITDRQGKMLSCEIPSLCGEMVIGEDSLEEEKENKYVDYAIENGITDNRKLMVTDYLDEEKGWIFVSLSDQGLLMRRISEQWWRMFFYLGMFSLVLFLIILGVSKGMTDSIRQVTDTMKEVEEGEYIRIPENPKRTAEIEIIANRFNSMIEKVEESIGKEREAVIRQKDAEILALEAQINPHFLYNILDTVNWMAIEKDEYEISDMLNSLADILRYGIDKRNRIVTVAEEMEWVKQYLFLQQTKLKNPFSWNIEAETQAAECHLHKLLFQPFIENAILHGFKGVDRPHELNICIGQIEERLQIVIADNGKGMSEEIVQKFQAEDFKENDEKNQIGISNALNRLRLYYGKEAEIKVESRLGEGTRITICIPDIAAGGNGQKAEDAE